jgi:hypothetical protein
MNSVRGSLKKAVEEVPPELLEQFMGDQARADGTYNMGLYAGRTTGMTNLFESGWDVSKVAQVRTITSFHFCPIVRPF